jgi:DNA polymerase
MSDISNSSYIKFLIKSGITSFLQNEPNNFYSINSKKTVSPILNKVNDITNINDLELYIKNYTNCNLKKQAKNTVIGAGNTKANIMLIGEAPGAEEDKIGEPFVGAAGQLLNKMLAAIKIERNSIYITNIIPWRPPNNRPPSSDEILQCLPFVQRHIEIISPKLILLLGSTAAKAILTTTFSVSKLRGRWHEYKSINFTKRIKCLVTYHPAFLLRSPNYKKQSWEDLKTFQKKIFDENL